MRTRTLALLLAGCTLLATWPVGAWAMARFEWIDARWLEALSTLAFTLPIGLAAAALTLVAHGLRINTELYDLLELDEEERVERREYVPDGAGSVSASPNVVTVRGGTAVAAASPAAESAEPTTRSNKMAVRDRGQGFGTSRDGKRPRKVQRTTKTLARRGSWAAKSAVRRKVRESMRGNLKF